MKTRGQKKRKSSDDRPLLLPSLPTTMPTTTSNRGIYSTRLASEPSEASASYHAPTTPSPAFYPPTPTYPTSSYPLSGAPSRLAHFGTDQVGVIGKDVPREILRVERDFSSGDIAQFYTSYPLELEGRVTPSQFQDLINDINALLLQANSFSHAVVDNVLMVVTFHLSLLVRQSHFEKELDRLERIIETKNIEIFNPAGLNVLSPRKKAFLFLEIEYY
ncbi:Golgin subfamily A member 7/ERF4 family-domain-containing protein [Mrakia frigida]|uniref:ERF4 family protein n=1 Tax=Mrakia frigida TaxID=29902 RepID=UPI003FCC22FE